VPFTIVRSTQFMELLGRIADAGTAGHLAHVPDVPVQPIAAVDVAGLIAGMATRPSVDGVVEIAGPERFAFADAIARVLAATDDRRRAVADAEVPYFGTLVRGGVLLPGAGARIGPLRLADWLSRRVAATVV
jgi:uncharacterized protein YbjT (DUF2867 family)